MFKVKSKLTSFNARRSSEANSGSGNVNWKGSKVGYGSLHQYVTYHFPKPKFCKSCKRNKPYDLANISGKYKRNLTDWEWLCRRCHMVKDGRLERLREIVKKAKRIRNHKTGRYEPSGTIQQGDERETN